MICLCSLTVVFCQFQLLHVCRAVHSALVSINGSCDGFANSILHVPIWFLCRCALEPILFVFFLICIVIYYISCRIVFGSCGSHIRLNRSGSCIRFLDVQPWFVGSTNFSFGGSILCLQSLYSSFGSWGVENSPVLSSA